VTSVAGRRPRPGLATAFAVVELTIATALPAAHGTIDGARSEPDELAS
jgi:hypothetical protein